MPARGLPLHASSEMREAHGRDLARRADEVLTKQPERPNVMSFGEQVVEALDAFVEAKLDYDRSRHGSNAEYANPEHVSRTGNALQELLDKVRHG